MKNSFFILVFLLATNLQVKAATNSAASLAYSDVLVAYNACANGDTLLIPAGAATWINSLTVTKGIRIFGAGTNATIITRTNARVFEVNLPADLPFRLSGMQLNIVGTPSAGNYPIRIYTSQSNTNSPRNNIRVDHVFIRGGYSGIMLWGINAWGVFDHNTFYNCHNSIQLCGGSYAWQYPIQAGTTNCAVIEDNVFITDDAGMPDCMGDENIMSGFGVRFVIRYNKFIGTNLLTANFVPYEHHGKGRAITTAPPDATELRAPPIYEIYNNTFAAHHTYRMLHIRGGSGLVWSNKFTTVSGLAPLVLTEDDYLGDTSWPGIDQVANTFLWGNTLNGILITNVSLKNATDPNYIQINRDYFMHAPDSSSGRMVWPDWPGSHNGYFVANVAQAYYPYTPLVYPHPLVTEQDGGGGTNPPSITEQPLAVTNSTTSGFLLSVKSVGSGSLRYQWRMEGRTCQAPPTHSIARFRRRPTKAPSTRWSSRTITGQ